MLVDRDGDLQKMWTGHGRDNGGREWGPTFAKSENLRCYFRESSKLPTFVAKDLNFVVFNNIY